MENGAVSIKNPMYSDFGTNGTQLATSWEPIRDTLSRYRARFVSHELRETEIELEVGIIQFLTLGFSYFNFKFYTATSM